MPEKLLTAKETADLLGISEEKLEEFVQKGELPAYKVGGQYLRFIKEQIEAIRDEVLTKQAAKDTEGERTEKIQNAAFFRATDIAYEQSFSEKVLDFLYFYDFYIISGFIIALILWFIFK